MRTVQLVAVQMLRSRVTLAAPLKCAFKLAIRLNLPGSFSLAWGSI